jgi:hypothetical protein
MFKVGDKVRIVGDILGFKTNDTAIISYVNEPYVKVNGNDQQFHSGWWKPDNEPVTRRYLPDNDSVRKDYPLFDGLFGYFPNALCEVARWSKHSNQQHNPGEPMHWAKDKSTDHKNKIMRHTLDAEQLNKDGFYEAIGAAWRALALAEEILVTSGKPWGPNVK